MLLPSGYRVRGVIPGLPELARLGLLERRVIAATLRLADPKWLTQAPEDEQELALGDLLDAKVAGFPREALDPGADPETGEWKAVHLTVADLPNMDQRDRALLGELIMHIWTADQITEAVLRGDYTLEGQVSPLDGLATFRDDGAGPAGGPDGTGVAGAPEPATAGAG